MPYMAFLIRELNAWMIFVLKQHRIATVNVSEQYNTSLSAIRSGSSHFIKDTDFVFLLQLL